MLGLKTRTWIIGGAVAALVGTGAIASRYYNATMEDRVHFATYMISKNLDLNDTQESSLDQLADNWMSSAATMKAFRKSIFSDVKSMASGEDLSVEQVNELREKVKHEFDRRADKILPQFVSFYNSLDKSQREKIVARLDKFSERMEKDGHRRHWGKGFHGHFGDED